MSAQRPLFADLDAVDPAAVDDRVRDLATRLSPRIHLGTSSWSFPGWTGFVYAARNGKPATEQTLARHGLAAYAAHPLLRTVSLDRTFYAPLTAPEFAAYAAQVPDHFRFVVKAPAAFTDPAIRKSGSGEPARDNPSFLDGAAAATTFVRPCLAAHARMPPVPEQAAAFGLAAADCPLPLVARWNLHAGRGYEEAKADYLPFNRLVEEDPVSREALATLARQAAAAGRDAFVTINNKAEGSAPLSVLNLATAITCLQ